jgi:hypothetical protein
MINITKVQTDPKPLEDFKTGTQLLGADSPCNYTMLVNPQKNEYKLALLEEQHYLCAYCNRNLDEFTEVEKLHHLKIEHWYPQSLCKVEPNYNTPKGTDVAHENMLIVCPGVNVNPEFTHCDSSRTEGNTLTIKPQKPSYRFDNVFRYEGGMLKTENTKIQSDVNNELNLNDYMLIHHRNKVLDEFKKMIKANGKYNKEVLLDKYSTPNKENRLRGYCTVILSFIRNQLK